MVVTSHVIRRAEDYKWNHNIIYKPAMDKIIDETSVTDNSYSSFLLEVHG